MALSGRIRQQNHRIGWVIGLALLALLVALPGSAQAAAVTKTVRYRGYSVRVPANWPVFRLTPGSRTCARFNRHAVYLGNPSASQSCPAHAIGRTEALLIAPSAASAAGASAGVHAQAVTATASLQTQPSPGSEAQRAVGHGLEVTATWNQNPAVVRRALHVTRLMPATARPTPAGGARGTATVGPEAKVRANLASVGTTYTGLGFDVCSTPSTSTMRAWGSSPYRAVGIYIGGANMACSQPNLNSTWLNTEWAAGWHVFPIYVGLQAPGNSCGCASVTPSKAASLGRAAAADAVAQAQSVGIPAGNPIYDDMEGYSPGPSATSAVLTFLSAWTTALHADGYGSGVYSSGASGIRDLSNRYGTGYAEPDDIWVADWNGAKTTHDPYLPSSAWVNHQRLHQYNGGTNARYGGVTLNIDGDYLDAATAFGPGTPVVVPAAPTPSLRVNPTANGVVSLSASWTGMSGIASWRTLAGAASNAIAMIDSSRARGSVTRIAEHNAFPYYAVQAIGTHGQVIGTSATVATRPHLALYGHSAFVSTGGTVGVPAGCFSGSTCQVKLTASVGRTTIATTNAERLNGSSGLLFFKLSSTGRAMLARAYHRRLPVRIAARDISGASASSVMNLVSYSTVGIGPKRSARQSQGLRILGLSDFVLQSSTGGILAGCVGSGPCQIVTKISAGHQTVATTSPEYMGANSAGYLRFRLTRLRSQSGRQRARQPAGRVRDDQPEQLRGGPRRQRQRSHLAEQLSLSSALALGAGQRVGCHQPGRVGGAVILLALAVALSSHPGVVELDLAGDPLLRPAEHLGHQAGDWLRRALAAVPALDRDPCPPREDVVEVQGPLV